MLQKSVDGLNWSFRQKMRSTETTQRTPWSSANVRSLGVMPERFDIFRERCVRKNRSGPAAFGSGTKINGFVFRRTQRFGSASTLALRVSRLISLVDYGDMCHENTSDDIGSLADRYIKTTMSGNSSSAFATPKPPDRFPKGRMRQCPFLCVLHFRVGAQSL